MPPVAVALEALGTRVLLGFVAVAVGSGVVPAKKKHIVKAEEFGDFMAAGVDLVSRMLSATTCAILQASQSLSPKLSKP